MFIYFGRDSLVSLWTAAQGGVNNFVFCVVIDRCSEFSDIFDVEHFKRVLANDVRIVSALPSTHLMTRPVEGSPPLHVSPKWIRARYLKRV